MRGIFINCPNRDCKKPVFKDAYLRPGSYLTTKCFYCGVVIKMVSEPGRVNLSTELSTPVVDLEDDEDSGIVSLRL